jgi:hypothetical protein
MDCAKVLRQQMPNSSIHQLNQLTLAAVDDRTELGGECGHRQRLKSSAAQ